MPVDSHAPRYKAGRTPITLRLDDDDLAFIDELADRERFKRSVLIERIIAKWIMAYREGRDIGVLPSPPAPAQSRTG